jgi:hypothetical protein
MCHGTCNASSISQGVALNDNIQSQRQQRNRLNLSHQQLLNAQLRSMTTCTRCIDLAMHGSGELLLDPRSSTFATIASNSVAASATTGSVPNNQLSFRKRLPSLDTTASLTPRSWCCSCIFLWLCSCIQLNMPHNSAVSAPTVAVHVRQLMGCRSYSKV